MKMESEFELGNSVSIKDIDRIGVVVGFYLDEASTLWVNVRHIDNDGHVDSTYFLGGNLSIRQKTA